MSIGKANAAKKTVRLSKSRIADGLVCEKKAYLSIHSPDEKAEVSKTQQARFDAGNEVGERARHLFPGGHLVDKKPWEIKEGQAETKRLIDSGTQTIYEATFENDSYHCRLDILHRDSVQNPWNIYEVKSGVDAKSEYILDLSIQCWILNKTGIKWDKAHIIHLNRDCRYPDLSNLFVIRDVTDTVKDILKDLDGDVKNISTIVNQITAPEKGIGRHCVEPYECGFKSHCWKSVPEYSVFDLPRGWSLFDKGKLKIGDLIPDDLTASQELPYRAIVEDYFHIDKPKIKKAVSVWKFPLYHLDFETIGPAIPMYDGTGPYTAVPFQFSLHVQDSPGNKPKHFEFLQDDKSDPRRPLAEKLCEWIPQDAKTVMAFNAGFEERVLKQLATMYPDLSKRLLSIADKLVDPHPVIKANVYHKEFRGSFSLKDVAPALLGPKWRYENLEVSDGKLAQVVFNEMIADYTPSDRRKHLREQLLAYCAQDTLAMVELVNWLFTHSAPLD